ncbi:MAG: VPLPA-CTERM sorting domain-containing protein [Steroidobacteraceae bacterium]
MEGRCTNAFRGVLTGLVFLASSNALASTVTLDVKAYDNSTSGGTGVNTLSLTSGQLVTVTASPLDTWGAGPPYRISNADGLTGDIYAVSGDDSGASPGTKIGESFGNWSQNGLSAPYGSLVGQIGSGSFFLIGVSETFAAGTSGLLKLFYFDSNNYDNFGQISVTVSAVPLPAAGWLMLSGLAAFGAFGRRRRVVDAGEPVAAA